jgi:hypothetical protein
MVIPLEAEWERFLNDDHPMCRTTTNLGKQDDVGIN